MGFGLQHGGVRAHAIRQAARALEEGRGESSQRPHRLSQEAGRQAARGAVAVIMTVRIKPIRADLYWNDTGVDLITFDRSGAKNRQALAQIASSPASSRRQNPSTMRWKNARCLSALPTAISFSGA